FHARNLSITRNVQHQKTGKGN
ncbi:uncharacterized protein METZ01_LOCUS221456, partial [marine metagenome]